ncbi:MAG: tRNA-dependent cyclodipeptide synthase [Acidimicrobiales bacterium]
MCGRCRPHLEARRHVCFGISPFNGHFTRSRVAAMAAWGRQQFGSMHFFVPDVPAASTLEALGYAPERAASKARRQANLVRNKIRAALSGVGVDKPDEFILDWAALSGNDRYRELLTTATELFDGDAGFRRACLDATAWVLGSRMAPDTAASPRQLGCAVRYLLAEVPLFADAAGIVGQELSVFCYHDRVPFLERFYRGELAVRPAARQGFALLATGEC